jgi:hypothetical protein
MSIDAAGILTAIVFAPSLWFALSGAAGHFRGDRRNAAALLWGGTGAASALLFFLGFILAASR